MTIYPLPLMLILMAAQYVLGGFPSLARGFAHPVGVIAWVLLVTGLLLMVIAVVGFKTHQTTVNPANPPQQLVTTGLYRFSRNPMYLGMLMELFFVPLMSMQPRGLTLTLVFFLVMHFWVIPREERRITQTFGQVYEQYCQRVRRWL